MADFTLLQPYWLLLLPLVWLWWRKRSHNPGAWQALLPIVAIRYPPLAHLRQTEPAQARQENSAAADHLSALAMLLMVVALAQPVRYTGTVATAPASEPVDLVLVVGTAISMSLRDYTLDGQPIDRMLLTRQLLDDFVREYSGSRIGLVILGNPPAVWLPLTTDKKVVADAVSRIRTTLGGRLTDMGATLQLVRDSYSAARDTVVLVISDGGLQLGAVSPLDAARSLADAGFTLYVAAIGATDPDAIGPSSGQLIYQPVDLSWLSQLAEAGGGQMFHARDAAALRNAMQTIEARHRKPSATPRAQRLTEAWYPVPLVAAMLLFLFKLFHPLLNSRTASGDEMP